METKDGFVVCPCCGSNMCYAQQIGDIETWICMSCGKTSSTLMKQGSKTEQQVTEKQPQIYRDLSFVDTDGYVWYPAVLTVPDKGMVYIDINTNSDGSKVWEWVETPMRKLTSKEKKMKQFKGKSFTTDIKGTKRFGKEGFVEAAVAAGFFNEE